MCLLSSLVIKFDYHCHITVDMFCLFLGFSSNSRIFLSYGTVTIIVVAFSRDNERELFCWKHIFVYKTPKMILSRMMLFKSEFVIDRLNYKCPRYMAEILPIRRETLYNQSINKLQLNYIHIVSMLFTKCTLIVCLWISGKGLLLLAKSAKGLLEQYQHHTNEGIETVRKLGTVHF